MVDKLVTLSYPADPPDGSFVTRNLFLTFAKKYFGWWEIT